MRVQQGMQCSEWVTTSEPTGVARTVTHEQYPDFRIQVTLAKPHYVDAPSAWEAHVEEEATGLVLRRTGFVLRYDAETWAMYRVKAVWRTLTDYQRLVNKQTYEHLLHDGHDSDQRALLETQIELDAKRLQTLDQDDEAFWQDFADDLDIEPDPPPPPPDPDEAA